MKNFITGLLVIFMGVLVLWGFSGQYHINCDSGGNCTYHETKDYPKPITLNHHKFQLRDGDELLCYDTSTSDKTVNKYKVLIRNKHSKTYATYQGFEWKECEMQRVKLQEALDSEDKSLTFSDDCVPGHVLKLVILACIPGLWAGIKIIFGTTTDKMHVNIH